MLTSVDLQYFKCFDLLRLPLAPLTLLTGPNASGKSSVLQALALLHQTMTGHEWSTRLALNGSVVHLGAMRDVVDEVSGSSGGFGIAIRNDNDALQWTFEGERQEMSARVRQVIVNSVSLERPNELRHLLPPNIETHTTSLLRSILRMTYITAERIAPQETYALEDPSLVDIVGPRGEYAISVLQWRRDDRVLNDLILPDAHPWLLRQVESRMRTLFPGFTMELTQSPGVNAVSLRMRTSDASDFHSPIHTGFGLSQVLPIIVATLSARKGDVILIENPEIHLHPAGQALMGRFLADVSRAGVQVLIETHSDHVLNGVRRAVKSGRVASDLVAIHFFTPRMPGSAQVVSPLLDRSGNIDYWPDGFFDQFDKDMNYFAGWV